MCQPTSEDMKLYITTRRDQEEGGELDSHEEVRHFCGSRRDQEEGGELDSHEEVRHFCGSRRDQEEGGELDSHEEVRHLCGSRRDQEEGGGAGPSRQRVLKFRLSNHRLPIQQRRSLGIPRDEIICTVCDSGEVGDEFHCLINCSDENVKRNRTKYVGKYYTHHPNVPKFCSLMNMTSKSKNVKLAKCISCIFELFWLSQ